MSFLWEPAVEKDISDGIASGVLAENHFMEVKESARNEQIAQTLASLAIDGGVFILGIAEQKNDKGSKALVPKPLFLEGLVERVDGISRLSIDPPLPVRTKLIRSSDDPDRGYAVITVQPSPLAPHMAGNRYYGRGEASKHALSDSEVLRFHQRREQFENLGERLLDEAEANDYLPPSERQFGHIYLVAEPLLPVRRSLVSEFLESEMDIRNLVSYATDKCRINLQGWYPTPSDAFSHRLRDSGVSMVSLSADGPGRSLNPQQGDEDGLFDIELTESGGIRIFIGRGTEPSQGTGEPSIFDGLAVAYAQRLTYWVQQLSERYGYGSMWTMGLRLNGIKGLRAYSKTSRRRTGPAGGTFEGDTYSRVCTVNSSEVLAAPDDVVEALVGRLLKVLGTTNEHLSAVR